MILGCLLVYLVVAQGNWVAVENRAIQGIPVYLETIAYLGTLGTPAILAYLETKVAKEKMIVQWRSFVDQHLANIDLSIADTT